MARHTVRLSRNQSRHLYNRDNVLFGAIRQLNGPNHNLFMAHANINNANITRMATSSAV